MNPPLSIVASGGSAVADTTNLHGSFSLICAPRDGDGRAPSATFKISGANTIRNEPLVYDSMTECAASLHKARTAATATDKTHYAAGRRFRLSDEEETVHTAQTLRSGKTDVVTEDDDSLRITSSIRLLYVMKKDGQTLKLDVIFGVVKVDTQYHNYLAVESPHKNARRGEDPGLGMLTMSKKNWK